MGSTVGGPRFRNGDGGGTTFHAGFDGSKIEGAGRSGLGNFDSVTDSFATAVLVGYKEPIARTPDVCPERLKQSNLDDWIYQELAVNYKSAEEQAEGLEKKFREDEAAGMMHPSKLGGLRAEFPGKPILVAALAST